MQRCFGSDMNVFFTFVFPPCKCVRLHIMTSFLETFCYKKEFTFLNWINLLTNCQILSVFQTSFISNSFRIRSWPYPEWFFPDQYPDPAKILDPDPQHCLQPCFFSPNDFYVGQAVHCDWSTYSLRTYLMGRSSSLLTRRRYDDLCWSWTGETNF